MFVIVPVASASTYLPVGDETYDALRYLEAEGVIESGLLTSLPLSMKEVMRLISEAERNSGDRGPMLRQVVASLKDKYRDEFGYARYIKPVGNVYSAFVFASQDPAGFVYNNDGDEYSEEGNLRLGLSSRADLGWFSALLSPEFRYSSEGADLVLKRGYIVLGFWGLELQIGKDSQWWGPGYHGSLLLSNNPEPLTVFRLTNPRPFILPWMFKYLGHIGVTFFVSRLEEQRAVPEPYLWGLRVVFKPVQYVEIGLERTAILGGEGRSEDLGTWWKSFTGKGENVAGVEAGDQRAGGDVKVTLPFRVQPLQLYLEAAGEDEGSPTGPVPLSLPSKWAHVAGIYLPRIFQMERLAFRAEYAENHIKGQPDIWYNHHIYLSGYTYKGRIIGHHMGTDSDDIFFKLEYRLPELGGMAYAWFDKKRHELNMDVKPTEEEITLGLKLSPRDNLRVEWRYTHGELNDSSDDKDVDLFMLKLDYTL